MRSRTWQNATSRRPSGANLQQARLNGANLTDAGLSGAWFSGAWWDNETTWPPELSAGIRTASEPFGNGHRFRDNYQIVPYEDVGSQWRPPKTQRAD